MRNDMQTSPYQNKFNPGSSHSILASWLRECAPGTTILDIGTASGTLGWRCQGQGLVFTGVEPVEAWAELARPFYQEICVSALQQAPPEFLAGHQVVVCADVLEHLSDPETQLARLVSLQPAGAVFLISVPNIANLWVRLHLLTGHFDYAERGILDRTHLRFFTRQSLLKMVASAGLQVERLIPSAIPLELAHPFFAQSAPGRFIHRLLAVLTHGFPTLLGYQFILYAVKPV